jgi:hypothetical protein
MVYLFRGLGLDLRVYKKGIDAEEDGQSHLINNLS